MANSKQTSRGSETYKHNAGGRHHTKIGDSIRHAGESVDHFSQQAGDKTDEFINKGSKIASELKQRGQEYGEKVIDYVKENPVRSTLIAGAVGLVIGRLFKRKI